LTRRRHEPYSRANKEIAAVPEIAWINGEFLPLECAMVHVEDRGFQFADAVYEVVRTYNGKPFALPEHMARLFRSLAAIQLDPGLTREKLESIILEAIARGGFAESLLYLQITRGPAPRHRGFPATPKPTVVITVRALKPAVHLRENGVSVITVPDIRWSRCDIKSVGLLANVLAYETAKKTGAYDAIFISDENVVTEATAANIFIVRHGTLITPPKCESLLPGVTRDKILHAGQAAGVAGREEVIRKDDLYAADEVFLTSTTAEVVPVIAVDGRPIGGGKPGPVSARICQKFLEIFSRL
jgi:D-alanine transaminase